MQAPVLFCNGQRLLSHRATMNRDVDLLVVGDPRYVGGTGAAMAEEMRVAAATGYRVGLLPVESASIGRLFPINPRIRKLLDQGDVALFGPDGPIAAELALVHNPVGFTCPVQKRPSIRCGCAVLVAHHPPAMPGGGLEYDTASVAENVAELVGQAPLWTPVGPSLRDQLAASLAPGQLMDEDWHNIIDVAAWPARGERPVGRPVVIGRHSRPDPRKWPDERDQILEAYPADPAFEVRILGGGAALEQLAAPYPHTWRVRPFDPHGVGDFLRGLDLFVYFHHSNWLEAFGIAIVEAMAVGLPVVLPPSFERLFGCGAVYVERQRAAARVLELADDPAAYRWQARIARETAEARFGDAACRARLQRLLGPPSPRRCRATPPLPRADATADGRRERVLFLTSNGVGVGHLTRMLAVARRLDTRVEPVFVTLSQAASVVAEQGYETEFIPDYLYLGADRRVWSHYLRQELDEIVGFYRPRLVLFDSHNPYDGFVEASLANRQCFWLWSRRSMWPKSGGRNFIEREPCFDGVIEPEDLAHDFDVGPTVERREHVMLVPPIRLLDEDEMLPRAAARAELGLCPDAPAVLLMLGAGNTGDYRAVRELVLRAGRRRPRLQLAALEWLIANAASDYPPEVRVLQRYPMARWLRAFDGVISAAGYNSFHELLFAGVPAVFVPNEHPLMENQLGRARWAERQGLAVCLRAHGPDLYRLDDALDWLLAADTTPEVAARAAGLERRNGAHAVAALVEEMLSLTRIDRRREPARGGRPLPP